MASILLIEDDADILANAGEILTLARHEVMMASSGKEGIELARSRHPDVIVCDILMPGIDGFGVLHILKEDPTTRDIQFVFLSSRHDDGDYRQAINLGANDYLVKPFTGSGLLKAIEARLKVTTLLPDRPPESGEAAATEISQAGQSQKDPPKTGTPARLWTHSVEEATRLLCLEGETEVFEKKRIIYKEDTYPRYLYFVKSGKVKAHRNHIDGKELIVDLYAPGDFMGYAPLLQRSNHIETTEVLEEAELILIPRTKFEELIHRDAGVMTHFLNKLSADFIDKDQRLLGLAYNTLRKKVADALVFIDRKFNKSSAEFAVTIEREELASIAGTATESLIRTLYEFKNENLIEIKKGLITAIKTKDLEHLRR